MLSSPETAVLAETNKTVPVEDVEIGTLILICAGDKIPLDGDVVEGKAAVDESSLTGESTPVYREKGNQVFSGGLVQSGYLKVCIYLQSWKNILILKRTGMSGELWFSYVLQRTHFG